MASSESSSQRQANLDFDQVCLTYQIDDVLNACRSIVRQAHKIDSLDDGDFSQEVEALPGDVDLARESCNALVPFITCERVFEVGPVVTATAHEWVIAAAEKLVLCINVATTHEPPADRLPALRRLLDHELPQQPKDWDTVKARVEVERRGAWPDWRKSELARWDTSGQGQPNTDPPPKSATVNERMAGYVITNSESLGWKSPQWAEHLKCSRSTVTGTAIWKQLDSARRAVQAERMNDRRRKPKASDQRRK